MEHCNWEAGGLDWDGLETAEMNLFLSKQKFPPFVQREVKRMPPFFLVKKIHHSRVGIIMPYKLHMCYTCACTWGFFFV